MRIMVFDVPAISGGALSILNEFYNEVTSFKDKEIEWIFVLSKPTLKETQNVKVLRYPWIKQSWLHRLYFDKIISPKLVKKYKVDKVLSLQNIIIPNVNCEQILYLHQPLPFVKYKFTFKQNKLFWIYQNIIGYQIKKSVKKSERTIVQTEWMKKACIETVNIDAQKIKVVPPNINVKINKFFQYNECTIKRFFYPAGAMEYKNHHLIVEALKNIKKLGVENFEVIFTLVGNENSVVKELYKTVKEYQLPIKFIGNIDRNDVFDYYSKSVLIFPSYIETFGLPLLEAKQVGSIILASDTEFSKEILYDYENVYYFNPFNESELTKIILMVLNGEINYQPILENHNFEIKKSILEQMLL